MTASDPIPLTSQSNPAPTRVLLVDDDEDGLTILTSLIRRLRCQVDAVTSMEAAERLLDGEKYDFVITDLRLTGMLGEEGLEILEYVKETSPSTHVILVTGYGDPQLMTRAYHLGAACYFEKPVDPTRLIEAMTELQP